MKKKLFLGVYNPSIILTYISVFCSTYGLGQLALYDENSSINILSLCMALLAVAGVCDMFDGKVARMCKRTEQEKKFGIQLDSLADTVSFVIFPAVMLMFMCRFHIASFIVSCFYVFAGIMRLGWFNVITEENQGVYFGLPVTFAALIFPSAYVILKHFGLNISGLFSLILYTIVSILFISNFKFKKPTLKFTIVMILVAILVITGLLIF